MLAKRIFLFMGLLFLTVLVSGCISLSTVEHERTDLQIKGNEGYILGQPGYKERKAQEKTRKIIRIDVDFSNLQGYGPAGKVGTEEQPLSQKNNFKKSKKTETPANGGAAQNKGYLETKTPGKALQPQPEFKQEYINKTSAAKQVKQPTSYTVYTVKKNESLWDIAGKPEIYGDPTKWTLIYEANKDKLKKPNLIRAGMKLNIPRY